MVIGLAGAARVGKDTIANLICSLIPRCEKIAFAHAVKEECEPICQDRWGISAWTEDPEQKKIVRPVLIDIGHGRRQDCPTYWIDRARDKVYNSKSTHQIITDVRYANEADFVRSLGGFVIMIKRNAAPVVIPTEIESLAALKADIVLDVGDTHLLPIIAALTLGAEGRDE